MPEPPAGPSEGSTSPFDGPLARHLKSVPDARLYVGDDLRRAHWPGVEATFGPLLPYTKDPSILALYDDSALGRGRLGFVVTDRHLVYVQRGGQGIVPLASLRRVQGVADGVRLHIAGLDGKDTVDLHVDEWEALLAVQAWLEGVVSLNRTHNVARPISAEQALARLEALHTSGRLRKEDRERLRRLVARIGRDDAG